MSPLRLLASPLIVRCRLAFKSLTTRDRGQNTPVGLPWRKKVFALVTRGLGLRGKDDGSYNFQASMRDSGGQRYPRQLLNVFVSEADFMDGTWKRCSLGAALTATARRGRITESFILMALGLAGCLRCLWCVKANVHEHERLSAGLGVAGQHVFIVRYLLSKAAVPRHSALLWKGEELGGH